MLILLSVENFLICDVCHTLPLAWAWPSLIVVPTLGMPALHVQIEQNQVVSSLVVMRCDGSVSAFLQAKIHIQDAVICSANGCEEQIYSGQRSLSATMDSVLAIDCIVAAGLDLPLRMLIIFLQECFTLD
jgi:hypothetical protein